MIPKRLLSPTLGEPLPTSLKRLILRELDTPLGQDPGSEDFRPRKPKGMAVIKNQVSLFLTVWKFSLEYANWQEKIVSVYIFLFSFEESASI